MVARSSAAVLALARELESCLLCSSSRFPQRSFSTSPILLYERQGGARSTRTTSKSRSSSQHGSSKYPPRHSGDQRGSRKFQARHLDNIFEPSSSKYGFSSYQRDHRQGGRQSFFKGKGKERETDHRPLGAEDYINPRRLNPDLTDSKASKLLRERITPWLMSDSTLDRLERLRVPTDALDEFKEFVNGELLEQDWSDLSLLRCLRHNDGDWTPVIDGWLTRRYLTYLLESVDGMPGETIDKPALRAHLRQILDATDLRYRFEGYHNARQLPRKFHLHIGPTNSGKTYNALKALALAERGAYAGPLRLLAHEAWERINRGTVGGLVEGQGRPCNLITGEERRIVSLDAGLIACTVEMLPLHTPLDVVVIDEIQMLADSGRGSAWTTAIMGMQAKEIHLCGEETVIRVVKEMVEAMGDTLTIHRYDRLTPLQVADTSLEGDLSKIQDGDCVVSFSRSGIFALKKQIESKANKKCAVVYGALPPETRSEQAKLFNEAGNGVNVMVASDAVGMGLNLKIKRIIFESLRKFNGKREVPLSISQIKQIAGRAGRFGQAITKNATAKGQKDSGGAENTNTGGIVTTLQEEDLPILSRVLKAPLPAVHAAYIEPPIECIAKLSYVLPPGTSYATLVSDFRHLAVVPSFCSYADIANTLKLAELLRPFEERLSLRELATFAYAPVNARDESVVAAFQGYMKEYLDSPDGEVKVEQGLGSASNLLSNLKMVELAKQAYPRHKVSVRHTDAQDEVEMNTSSNSSLVTSQRERLSLQPLPPAMVAAIPALESLHKALVLYIWLSFRFELVFSQRAEATKLKERTEDVLEFALERLPGLKRSKASLTGSSSTRLSMGKASNANQSPQKGQPSGVDEGAIDLGAEEAALNEEAEARARHDPKSTKLAWLSMDQVRQRAAKEKIGPAVDILPDRR